MSEILAHVTRGGAVECIHRGDLVVTDTEGKIVYSIGDPQKHTYWRSAAKPFQVIPLVEAEGMKRFDFSGRELALMTSSHGGEETHVAAVQGILDKIGLTADALECGAAPPMYRRAANKILKEGGSFSVLTNACSGKHAAILALAKIRDYPVEGYSQPIHPAQHEVLRAVADLAGLMPKDLTIGIDGCGFPVFGLPIYNMAIAYAHLANPHRFPQSRRSALEIIARAMTDHPHYVAGTNRLDTALMEATGGRILAKVGSEGVYSVSITDQGLSLTLKIEDGSSRPFGPVIIEALKKLNALTTTELETLHPHHQVYLQNHRKQTIGQIIPTL
ncbi:asparaginase [Dethiobacter alkaliphilus]|uniref:asparaginase n=1 Tax=Dethiobacter alkaliphilus TaxID=427926 RepID=UPI0022262E42|nr:asparaginase [Dethiobacter alkaliphilus]MCW3490520.1 asparaginase [Dethiobacter alkaliphilus]